VLCPTLDRQASHRTLPGVPSHRRRSRDPSPAPADLARVADEPVARDGDGKPTAWRRTGRSTATN